MEEEFETSGEEAWLEAFWRNLLDKSRKEDLGSRVVAQKMSAIRFTSFSKGGGRRRERPCEVVLLRYGDEPLEVLVRRG